MLSSRAERQRSFVVIGLGRFGSAVATELSRLGNQVLGIDSSEAVIADHVDKLEDCVVADSRDEDALREAGVGSYDVAVIGIGDDFEASILCTMNAKLLGIEAVWVKAQSRSHHRILSRVGADRVIEPEHDIGARVAQVLHTPLVRDYVSLGNGFMVYVLRVPKEIEGQLLVAQQIKTQHDVECLGAMREGAMIPVGEEYELRRDDRLLLLGRRSNLRACVSAL